MWEKKPLEGKAKEEFRNLIGLLVVNRILNTELADQLASYEYPKS